MQKIMFNDFYGLTQAVLEGQKTQTRIPVTYPQKYKGIDVAGFYSYRRPSDKSIVELCMYDEDEIPRVFSSPQMAYSELIDKVGRK